MAPYCIPCRTSLSTWLSVHTLLHTHKHTHAHILKGLTQIQQHSQRQEDVRLQAQTDRQMMDAYPSHRHIHASCSSLFTFVIPSSP